MVLSLAVLYLTLRLPQIRSEECQHTTRRIEYPSATLLLLIAIAASLSTSNFINEVFAWPHSATVILYCLTPVFIALFYYSETYVAVTPLLPKTLLRNRNVAYAFVCLIPMKFSFEQVGLPLLRPSHKC